MNHNRLKYRKNTLVASGVRQDELEHREGTTCQRLPADPLEGRDQDVKAQLLA